MYQVGVARRRRRKWAGADGGKINRIMVILLASASHEGARPIDVATQHIEMRIILNGKKPLKRA
jgi:hypothetical protein